MLFLLRLVVGALLYRPRNTCLDVTNRLHLRKLIALEKDTDR
jgi:hypothetical protein